MTWYWGHGANAVGRYFPWDKETCGGCGKRILKSDDPIYFEYRTLCTKCHLKRLK